MASEDQPSRSQTTVPESGYGKQLRAAADMMDQLIQRGRMCDAHCGGRDGEIDRLSAALAEAEAEARRYAGYYPQSSDGRNTFLILADRIAEIAEGKSE